jgi:hypothetical protein
MKVLLIRALCKDVEGLDATSKTRGWAGSRSLGGKAGSNQAIHIITRSIYVTSSHKLNFSTSSITSYCVVHKL